MIWYSTVQNDKLGALLGKDLIKALKLKIDFDSDLMDSPLLNVTSMPLGEMRVGHYKLELLNGKWDAPCELNWSAIGLDGVCMIPDCPQFVINGKFVDRANPQSISPDTHSLASVASELEPSKPPSVVLDAAGNYTLNSVKYFSSLSWFSINRFSMAS